MKSNKVFDASKRNNVRFIQPSALRKNVRKRQSFENIISTDGAINHRTMDSRVSSRRAHGARTSSDTEPIAGNNEDEFFMYGEGADGPESGEPLIQQDFTEPEVVKKKKVRSKNKCKRVGKLKAGEKLSIVFFLNGPVGVNRNEFTRYLGKLVTDNTICPVRVHSWGEMGNDVEDHLWAAVKEKFTNPEMEAYRGHIFKKMVKAWTNYRSDLNLKYVKPCQSLEDAIENVPCGIQKDDWEWLVTEHYLTEEFKKISVRNANNRAQGSMPCHLGSMSIGELTYQMTDKEGNMPSFTKVFSCSRQKGGAIDPKSARKEAELIETMHQNPGINGLDLVEKCFGPQKHGGILGYGSGITPKDLRTPRNEKNPEVEAQLQRSEEEKAALEEKNGALEAEKAVIAAEKEALFHRLNNMESNYMVELRSLREMVMLQQTTWSSLHRPHDNHNQYI
ncbi:unnamed protein product [Linum tenue]|uniref:Transposase, Ptta/En/Spm, plant n=2 Tax=Linum tenue TaxID=586396 RepID=A0AAV0ITA0_9ROSI|nr:unnamed protein product [Linum tenue]